jgi:hypothetical protein
VTDDDETWRKFVTKPKLKIVAKEEGPRQPRRLVYAIGAGLGLTSLAMNLTYAASQGASLADQFSWASGAGLIEALSLVMPSLALEFWRSRQRLASLFCGGIAIGAIVLATWSNLDYIHQVSGDHSASREAVAEAREGLRSSIALAQSERSSIAEPAAKPKSPPRYPAFGCSLGSQRRPPTAPDRAATSPNASAPQCGDLLRPVLPQSIVMISTLPLLATV